MTIKKGVEKSKTAPYDVSVMLSEKAAEVQRRISEILMEDQRKTEQQLKSELNKMAYDFAEKTGASLWDICLSTLPEWTYDLEEIEGHSQMVCKARITPIEFDFTHSPDYWEKKYYKLKNELQKLLNEKEE